MTKTSYIIHIILYDHYIYIYLNIIYNHLQEIEYDMISIYYSTQSTCYTDVYQYQTLIPVRLLRTVWFFRTNLTGEKKSTYLFPAAGMCESCRRRTLKRFSPNRSCIWISITSLTWFQYDLHPFEVYVITVDSHCRLKYYSVEHICGYLYATR